MSSVKRSCKDDSLHPWKWSRPSRLPQVYPRVVYLPSQCSACHAMTSAMQPLSWTCTFLSISWSNMKFTLSIISVWLGILGFFWDLSFLLTVTWPVPFSYIAIFQERRTREHCYQNALKLGNTKQLGNFWASHGLPFAGSFEVYISKQLKE